MSLLLSLSDSIEQAEVIELYRANNWSSAETPQRLLPALRNSHA